MAKKHTNEIAKKYEVGVNRITHYRQKYCIEKLLDVAKSIKPFSTVLDCPCGSGRFSELFNGYKLTCADLSEKRMTAVRSLISGDNIKFMCCDVFDMPFPDSSFDLILNALLLQHIKKEKLPDLFKELSRVTNSWLLITYSEKRSLLSIFRLFVKTSKRNTLTTKEFYDICNNAGFNVIKVMPTIPFLAATNVVLLRKK